MPAACYARDALKLGLLVLGRLTIGRYPEVKRHSLALAAHVLVFPLCPVLVPEDGTSIRPKSIVFGMER